MKQESLLKREISPGQAAKVIDFLRSRSTVWHDSYVLIKVSDSTQADFVLRKELSDRLGVPVRDVMPEGAYGNLLGKFEPLPRGEQEHGDRSYKAWVNFDGLNGEKIIRIGFKSALARIEKLRLGHETLDLLTEFAVIRTPSFLPEVPTTYTLDVKKFDDCPRVAQLDPETSLKVRQYLTECVEQLRVI